MRVAHAFILSAAVVPLAWAAACGSYKSTSPKRPPAVPPGVEALRASLAPYSSFALAKAAGYGVQLTDCMSNGDVGAMGIHFGKAALIDGELDPLRPEVLIYEPEAHDELSLVGVEFIIPFAVRPETAPAPVLFGQTFVADETFGLWALHVWTHRANPSGLFAPWNPRVHC